MREFRKPSLRVTGSIGLIPISHLSLKNEDEKDKDILTEEDFVAKTDKNEFALCFDKLGKIYPSSLFGGVAKHAVRGLTLGCREGERLGFLGVNGAGKSTTLGILTGDIPHTGR